MVEVRTNQMKKTGIRELAMGERDPVSKEQGWGRMWKGGSLKLMEGGTCTQRQMVFRQL